MKTVLVIAAIVLALVAIDRFLLWAEARGWIYWRRRERLGSQVGAAIAGELGAILSPVERTRQEIILRAEQLPAPDDPGGAPKPPENA